MEPIFAEDVVRSYSSIYFRRFERHPQVGRRERETVSRLIDLGFTPALLGGLLECASRLTYIDEGRFTLSYLFSDGVFRMLQNRLAETVVVAKGSWDNVPAFMRPEAAPWALAEN